VDSRLGIWRMHRVSADDATSVHTVYDAPRARRTYASMFEELGIDGMDLPGLTEQALKELYVTEPPHQRKLLSAARMLQGMGCEAGMGATACDLAAVLDRLGAIVENPEAMGSSGGLGWQGNVREFKPKPGPQSNEERSAAAMFLQSAPPPCSSQPGGERNRMPLVDFPEGHMAIKARWLNDGTVDATASPPPMFRWPVCSTLTFDALQKQLDRYFCNSRVGRSEFQIQYRDEDGDWLTVIDDETVWEALFVASHHTRSVLHIQVSNKYIYSSGCEAVKPL